MNFFVRPPKMEKIKSSYVPEKDIVRYERQDVIDSVELDEKGNPTKNFTLREDVVEVERTNRQEFINSFREDVGIANILKKVALSGDTSLYNQVQRTPQPIAADGKEMIQDITPLQAGEEAVSKMGDDMRQIFKDIPEDLKAGRTLEQFLEGVSQAEIDAFVKAQVEKKLGGNKDGAK